MNVLSAQQESGQTVDQVTGIFERISSTYFNTQSILALIVALTLAIVAGRLIASLLRRVVWIISNRVDRTENLHTVNRLRRYETFIILSIAIIRTFLILFALYVWWMFIHPNQQPTALIGASAVLAILLGGALSPALRDIASGSLMMAEQWYAVGDYVRVEPFMNMQGVVERVTLRSTRIRGLSGEVVWVNNQNIQAIHVTPKGIRTMGVELFVSDLDKGQELIEATNRRLPTGQLLVINPLHVMTSSKVGDKLWHITALAETAPGRDWLIQDYATKIMKEIDEDNKTSILATEPVARFADSEAERRFARAIRNARKAPRTKRVVRPIRTKSKTPSKSGKTD